MFDFENMKIYISCLYNSISCFKTGFGILGQNEKQAVAELCQAQNCKAGFENLFEINFIKMNFIKMNFIKMTVIYFLKINFLNIKFVKFNFI